MATNNWYGGARRAGIGAGASGRRLRGGNSGARGSQRQQQLGRQIEADYYFVRRIGGGSFGDVYLAEERANRSHKVAIKAMKRVFTSWEECRKLREVKSLMTLNKHPNVVRLLKVTLDRDNRLYLVFEFLPSNLYAVTQQQSLSIDQVREYMRQLFSALAHVHSVGYFHRDVKPENLLIAADGTLKIADFGEAREIRSRPPFTKGAGTRWYKSPELLLHSTRYNSPVDVWACGCVLGELLTGGAPLFGGQTELDVLNLMCQLLGTPTKEEWPAGYALAMEMGVTFPSGSGPHALEGAFPHAPASCIKLLRDVLSWDPLRRPSAKRALTYAFFTEAPPPARPAPPSAKPPALPASGKPVKTRARAGKAGKHAGGSTSELGADAAGHVSAASAGSEDAMNSVGALGHDRDGSDFMMSDCDEDLMSVLLAEAEPGAASKPVASAKPPRGDAGGSPGAGGGAGAAGLPPMRPAKSPVKSRRHGAAGAAGQRGPPPPHSVLGVQVSQDSAALLADILHDLSGSEDEGEEALAARTSGHGGVAASKARNANKARKAQGGVRGAGAGSGVGSVADEVVPLSSDVEPFDAGNGGGNGVVGGFMEVQDLTAGSGTAHVAVAAPDGGGGLEAVSAYDETADGDEGDDDDDDDNDDDDDDDGGGGGGDDDDDVVGGGDDGPMVSGEGAASYRPPTPPPPMGPALSRLTSDVRVQIHTPDLPRRPHPAKPAPRVPPRAVGVGNAGHVQSSDGAAPHSGTAAKPHAHVGAPVPAAKSAVGAGALHAAHGTAAEATAVGGAVGTAEAHDGARPSDHADAGNVSMESDASGTAMSFLTTPLSTTSSPARMPPVRVHGDGAHGEVEEGQAQRIRDAVDKLSRAELAYLVKKLMVKVPGAQDLTRRFLVMRRNKQLKRRRSKAQHAAGLSDASETETQGVGAVGTDGQGVHAHGRRYRVPSDQPAPAAASGASAAAAAHTSPHSPPRLDGGGRHGPHAAHGAAVGRSVAGMMSDASLSVADSFDTDRNAVVERSVSGSLALSMGESLSMPPPMPPPSHGSGIARRR